MEALLKAELGTSTLKTFGSAGGGCINEGQGYLVDQGKIFVKMNHKPEVQTITLEVSFYYLQIGVV